MKTFSQFMVEVYDKDVMQSSQIRRQGEGGRVGAQRKKSPAERRRMKAAGGGKMVPAKEYKSRSDIGTQRKTETRVQQPEQERGSSDVRARAAAAAKEERKKAAQARIAARKSGESAPAASKPKAKEAAKTASQLLAKKKKETVSPKYKPQKASGLSTQERKSLYKKGERTLRDVVLQATGKKSEKELKHKITSK